MDTEHEQAAGHGSPILHLRCETGVDEELFRLLLGLVADVTPLVQALPPSALVADVSGSLRYWMRDPAELAAMIRTRALALYGVPVRIGVASSWAVAAMASREPGPRGVCVVGSTTEAVEAFLHPRPVGELYGIGKSQADTLTKFGVHTIGLLANLPEATVQRVLGGRAGRLLRERARGIDRRVIVPAELPHSVSAARSFPVDTLAPDVVRAALLSCAVELGERLRGRQQAAKSVTLTLSFAGTGQLVRSRQLPGGPSAHTDDLRDLAYGLYRAMALQRARVRSVAVRGEQLVAAESVAEQLSLDVMREDRLRAENVVDVLNHKYGSGTVGPAASYRHAG